MRHASSITLSQKLVRNADPQVSAQISLTLHYNGPQVSLKRIQVSEALLHTTSQSVFPGLGIHCPLGWLV